MDDIELIKQKVSVVDLISEYLPLKKAGINFKANCPFHNEHTPSFMVSPERGIWKCFGCDRGGDVFKFIMEKDGLEFPEALEYLAKKANIVLKKTKKVSSETQRLLEIHVKAQQFFSFMLKEHALGKKALTYLKKRGLTDKTITEFGLGYAPQNWESLTNFLKKRGFSTPEIILSGLGVSSNTGCYDRFRARIMFPLTDARDRILGFSGRILGAGEPKYVNSPQTPIFDKGRLLFGLQSAKGDIRQKNEAILAEGEMDMLMSYQSGVKNIVASKGTALTAGQIEILKKYTDTLSLCFDTDLAGDSASRRGIEIADKAGLNIKVIQVEEGAKDPADVCLADPGKWQDYVKKATPIFDYYLESVSKRFDLKLASSKKEIMAELLPIWLKITDPIVKDHYIQKLAALLQVKEGLINSQLSALQKSAASPTKIDRLVEQSPKPLPKRNDPIKISDQPTDRRKLLEEYLISLLLHIPIEHTYVPNFPETLLVQEELRQLYMLLVIFLDSISFKGKAFKINDFIKTLPPELVPTIDRLFLVPIDDKLVDPKSWQKDVEMAVTQLKRMLIKSSLEKLSLQIKSAQEFEKAEQLELLNRKFRDLSVKLKNL